MSKDNELNPEGIVASLIDAYKVNPSKGAINTRLEIPGLRETVQKLYDFGVFHGEKGQANYIKLQEFLLRNRRAQATAFQYLHEYSSRLAAFDYARSPEALRYIRNNFTNILTKNWWERERDKIKMMTVFEMITPHASEHYSKLMAFLSDNKNRDVIYDYSNKRSEFANKYKDSKNASIKEICKILKADKRDYIEFDSITPPKYVPIHELLHSEETQRLLDAAYEGKEAAADTTRSRALNIFFNRLFIREDLGARDELDHAVQNPEDKKGLGEFGNANPGLASQVIGDKAGNKKRRGLLVDFNTVIKATELNEIADESSDSDVDEAREDLSVDEIVDLIIAAYNENRSKGAINTRLEIPGLRETVEKLHDFGVFRGEKGQANYVRFQDFLLRNRRAQASAFQYFHEYSARLAAFDYARSPEALRYIRNNFTNILTKNWWERERDKIKMMTVFEMITPHASERYSKLMSFLSDNKNLDVIYDYRNKRSEFANKYKDSKNASIKEICKILKADKRDYIEFDSITPPKYAPIHELLHSEETQKLLDAAYEGKETAADTTRSRALNIFFNRLFIREDLGAIDELDHAVQNPEYKRGLGKIGNAKPGLTSQVGGDKAGNKKRRGLLADFKTVVKATELNEIAAENSGSDADEAREDLSVDEIVDLIIEAYNENRSKGAINTRLEIPGLRETVEKLHDFGVFRGEKGQANYVRFQDFLLRNRRAQASAFQYFHEYSARLAAFGYARSPEALRYMRNHFTDMISQNRWERELDKIKMMTVFEFITPIASQDYIGLMAFLSNNKNRRIIDDYRNNKLEFANKYKDSKNESIKAICNALIDDPSKLVDIDNPQAPLYPDVQALLLSAETARLLDAAYDDPNKEDTARSKIVTKRSKTINEFFNKLFVQERLSVLTELEKVVLNPAYSTGLGQFTHANPGLMNQVVGDNKGNAKRRKLILNFKEAVRAASMNSTIDENSEVSDEAREHIHVFIGAGPANLHRALKIKKGDPDASFIFIDSRLNLEPPYFERDKSRANIFRFEREGVTDKLLKDGLDKRLLDELAYERPFDVSQGFQYGDEDVFSDKDFTQIQIRDLQELLLHSIMRGDENTSKSAQHEKYKIVRHNIDLKVPVEGSKDEMRDATTDEIAAQVYDKIADKRLNTRTNKVSIHVASGALSETQNDTVVYNAKAKLPEVRDLSDDLAALHVVPTHATVTFNIEDEDFTYISCEQLKAAQKSLDDTNWPQVMGAYGWGLIRPPRVRIFYANDVLYVGAEIPHQLADADRDEYETKVADYMRDIAKLSFPTLSEELNSLEAREHLRTRFDTARGESGVAVTKSEKFDSVSLFRHGDQRYLPHYQTGSGFVTAFKINELYAEIYQKKHFKDLVDWALAQECIVSTEDAIRLSYSHLPTERECVEAIKTDLFTSLSRDIIELNKNKVGTYFNALHRQEINAMADHIQILFNLYNTEHSSVFSVAMCEGIDPRWLVIKLLDSDNEHYLKQVLPYLVNVDLDKLTPIALLQLKEVHLEDYRRNLLKYAQTIPELDATDFTTNNLDRLFAPLRRTEGENKVVLGDNSWGRGAFNMAKPLVDELHLQFGQNASKFIKTEDVGFISEKGRAFIIDLDELNKPEYALERKMMSNMLLHIERSPHLDNSRDKEHLCENLKEMLENIRKSDEHIRKVIAPMERAHFGSIAGESDEHATNRFQQA